MVCVAPLPPLIYIGGGGGEAALGAPQGGRRPPWAPALDAPFPSLGGGGDGRGDAGASHVAVDTVRGRGRYGLTGRGRAVSWSSGTPDSTAGRGGRWQRPLGLVGRGRGQFDTGAGSSVHGRLILAGRKAMMRPGGDFGGVGRGAGGAGGGGGRGAGCLGGGRVADKDDMHANTGVHAAAGQVGQVRRTMTRR